MTLAADAHIDPLASRNPGILAKHLHFDAGFIDTYELLIFSRYGAAVSGFCSL